MNYVKSFLIAFLLVVDVGLSHAAVRIAYDRGGRIDIYVHKYQRLASSGESVVIDGLWALTPGNNGGAGSADRLYFTAGPDEESHGLVGVLNPVPEPATLTLFGTGLGTLLARRRRPRA